MIHKLVVMEGFLTLYVVETDDGVMVRVNGKEVKRLYGSVDQAKRTAELGAMKLMNEAQAILQRPITSPYGYKWEVKK